MEKGKKWRGKKCRSVGDEVKRDGGGIETGGEVMERFV